MTPDEQLEAFDELLVEMMQQIAQHGTLLLPPESSGSWWLAALNARTPVHCDYYVAHGWYNKMLGHLKLYEVAPANAAGRNMLDAIVRVFTRIGIDKAHVDEFLRARGFEL